MRSWLLLLLVSQSLLMVDAVRAETGLLDSRDTIAYTGSQQTEERSTPRNEGVEDSPPATVFSFQRPCKFCPYTLPYNRPTLPATRGSKAIRAPPLA
ncbi:hypothetical protein [Microbulbifer discodermiae]|uniref:hypothetical protein n=1 Tax=Microbulbifer sp. 2201CG32-9 TaxID=3232309 RepID=UPI00345B73E9